MKLAVGLFVVFWFLCGWAAASWQHDHSFRTIALGPISLAQAYNDNPMSLPGPN